MKSLLNVASMSAIQLKGEYKNYYQRRCDEGKNKMSSLNIIRNKLVFRAFAVVKRGTPYVNLSTFAAYFFLLKIWFSLRTLLSVGF